jgi:hypothetical protein
VFLVSPVTPSDTGDALAPVTVAGVASTVKQPELMPLSSQRTNDTFASARFAFTVPFNVTVVLVIAVAADVVTAGTSGFSVLNELGVGLAAVTEPAVTWK